MSNINMDNPNICVDMGRNIEKKVEEISAIVEEIKKTADSLSGWKSRNKEKFDALFAENLPKMMNIIDVLGSYGRVARQAGERVIAADAKISEAFQSISD